MYVQNQSFVQYKSDPSRVDNLLPVWRRSRGEERQKEKTDAQKAPQNCAKTVECFAGGGSTYRTVPYRIWTSQLGPVRVSPESIDILIVPSSVI